MKSKQMNTKGIIKMELNNMVERRLSKRALKTQKIRPMFLYVTRCLTSIPCSAYYAFSYFYEGSPPWDKDWNFEV